jgi:hypothetical protein
MNSDMRVLMEGWRKFLVEGEEKLREPKGPNSRTGMMDEEELEEGDEDSSLKAQQDRELDDEGDGRMWDTARPKGK